MGVTLITCTGGRPEAFRLCEMWMADQTYKRKLQWIVVDDVYPPTFVNLFQQKITPPTFWDGQHTLSRNLRLALKEVKEDKILFIEDDDFYSPAYVARMVEELDFHNLVGEAPARYYNVATTQHLRLSNKSHASLCQTGMRTELMERFLQVCTDSRKFIDIDFWNGVLANKIILPTENSVGIKGMPGRYGIGVGHHPPPHWAVDKDGSILESWVGKAAAKIYMSYRAVAK